jgi:hypothetical protein
LQSRRKEGIEKEKVPNREEERRNRKEHKNLGATCIYQFFVLLDEQ